MVNVEPYEYQRKTNLKEHNDLVAKINEIVDVINNSNLDTILPKISKLETDVSTINATDSLQWTDIENLKTKNTEYDTHFALNDSQIDGITKSLVSNVALMNGTTTGNVKVRIGKKDAPSIDSDDYNIQKPTSVELIQGSAPAMVKAQITLSDGTVLISDDFMFTTEAIGTDVYISSFVFKNGNVAGTISADIGLSNGSTLTANNFAVPTDPNVTSAIADLTSRTEALEQIDIGALKTTVDGHTASINALDSDVANLQIDKADVTNTEQIITNKRVDTEIVRYKYNNTDAYGIQSTGTENDPFLITGKKTIAGQEVYVPIGKIAVLDSDGTPTNFRAGGEVWEEVDLNNWPTDWVQTDIVKVRFYCFEVTSTETSWSNAPQFLTNDVNINNISGDVIMPIKNTKGKLFAIFSRAASIALQDAYISGDYSAWNDLNGDILTIESIIFNGGGKASKYTHVTPSTASNYIAKMYRLKQ